jgi:hypothetical protein
MNDGRLKFYITCPQLIGEIGRDSADENLAVQARQRGNGMKVGEVALDSLDAHFRI